MSSRNNEFVTEAEEFEEDEIIPWWPSRQPENSNSTSTTSESFTKLSSLYAKRGKIELSNKYLQKADAYKQACSCNIIF